MDRRQGARGIVRSEDFMPGPVGLPVIDTMIGFPHEGFRPVRLHPQTDQGPRIQRGFRVPGRVHVQGRPAGPADRRPGVAGASADGPVRHRESDDRGWGRLRAVGTQDIPRSLRPFGSARRPQRRHGFGERDSARLRTVRHPSDVGVSRRNVSASSDRRPEDVPDLCHLRRTRHPDLRLRGCPRATGSLCVPGGRHASTS